mgnify:CR=1 FL=1
MDKKFFLVGDDAIADFHGSWKSFGFSVDDLELAESVKQSVGPISGAVTLSHRSSGPENSTRLAMAPVGQRRLPTIFVVGNLVSRKPNGAVERAAPQAGFARSLRAPHLRR